MPLVWERTWQSSTTKRYARCAFIEAQTPGNWGKGPYYEIAPTYSPEVGATGWKLTFTAPRDIPRYGPSGRPPGTAPTKISPTEHRDIGEYSTLKEAEEAAERDFEERHPLRALGRALKNPKLRWQPLSRGELVLQGKNRWSDYETAWSTSHGGREYLLIHGNDPEYDTAFFYLQRAAPGQAASSRGELVAEKRMTAVRSKRERAKRSRLAKFWAESHIISPLRQLADLGKKNPMKPGWELWLPLDEIEPFVPLMERQGVSEVARSKRGFLTAYRKAGGDPSRLGSDPKFGQNWVERRNNFVARHMGQITKRGEELWQGGDPSRRHLALIAWAYTPDPDRVKAWIASRELAAANPYGLRGGKYQSVHLPERTRLKFDRTGETIDEIMGDWHKRQGYPLPPEDSVSVLGLMMGNTADQQLLSWLHRRLGQMGFRLGKYEGQGKWGVVFGLLTLQGAPTGLVLKVTTDASEVAAAHRVLESGVQTPALPEILGAWGGAPRDLWFIVREDVTKTCKDRPSPQLCSVLENINDVAPDLFWNDRQPSGKGLNDLKKLSLRDQALVRRFVKELRRVKKVSGVNFIDLHDKNVRLREVDDEKHLVVTDFGFSSGPPVTVPLAANPRRRRNPDLLSLVPPEIKNLGAQIKRYSKEGRAVLIGGSVIDLLQGRTPKDWDIEVHGYSYPKLEELMRTLGYPSKTVGRQFGILIVRVGDHDVDLSIPRKESKVGVGHKGFEVTFPKMTPKEAAQRRDFTINAMGADLTTGELIDPWGGMADLQRGVLRATDPKTFVEDPLRALRAMQLLARKAKSVEPATLRLIQSLAPHYPELAKERVFEEFNKLLLKANKPSTGLQFLRHSGWLHWFPELAAQIGVPQRREWHSEGDVWNHMLLTVNQAARIRHCIPEEHRLAYMYAAMLHDVGKPATTRLEKEPPELWLTAHGHDVAGKEPAEAFMRRLTDDRRLIAKVSALVGEHMQPYNLTQAEAGLPAYIRLTKRLREHGVDLPLLARISQADKAGSLRPGEAHRYLDPKTCEPSWDHEPSKKLAWAHGEIERRGVLEGKKVQGRDLIALGYDPKVLAREGRIESFGAALNAAFQAQMDHPDWSKEQLIQVAVAYLKGDSVKGNPKVSPGELRSGLYPRAKKTLRRVERKQSRQRGKKEIESQRGMLPAISPEAMKKLQLRFEAEVRELSPYEARGMVQGIEDLGFPTRWAGGWLRRSSIPKLARSLSISPEALASILRRQARRWEEEAAWRQREAYRYVDWRNLVPMGDRPYWVDSQGNKRPRNYEFTWAAVFGEPQVEPAGARPGPFGRGDVVQVFKTAHTQDPPGGQYTDDYYYGLFRLADGRWGYVQAWNDTTGWGCQDSNAFAVADTLDDLIPLMSDEGRFHLGMETSLQRLGMAFDF